MDRFVDGVVICFHFSIFEPLETAKGICMCARMVL